jgi:hypothetical protein
LEEINAKTQGRKDAKDRGSPAEIPAVSVVDLSGCFIEGTLAMARTQYRQIDILIMLGKIGFEWFSAHAEGFLKAVGRKPSGEGSSVVFRARTLRKPMDI